MLKLFGCLLSLICFGSYFVLQSGSNGTAGAKGDGDVSALSGVAMQQLAVLKKQAEAQVIEAAKASMKPGDQLKVERDANGLLHVKVIGC